MMLLLFGPPGVGKGTQADLLTQNFQMIKFSMGDILREEVAVNSAIGNEVKNYLNQGTLAPDNLVFEMVEDFLIEHRTNDILFDGYPRNLNQAMDLEKALAQLNLRIDLALELSLDRSEIAERMASRRFCMSCGRIYNLITNPPQKENTCDYCHSRLEKREDDELEVINKRFQIYEEQTKPLVNYYKGLSVYHKIDATGSPQEIFQNIRALIVNAHAK